MILIHVGAIVCTALCVLYADEQGVSWMLGKKETLPAKRIRVLHVLVACGLSVIIASGVSMVYSSLDYYLSNPVFLVKMGFVLVLIVNAFFIGVLSSIAHTRAFRDVSSKEKFFLLVSGTLSVSGWIGAIACGLRLSGWW